MDQVSIETLLNLDACYWTNPANSHHPNSTSTQACEAEGIAVVRRCRLNR